MTMERDRWADLRPADEAADSEAVRNESAPVGFRYASRDEALAVAEQMMEEYEDVLRELAK